MRQGWMPRLSFLVVSCVMVSSAAPTSIGLLTLNNVGSAHADPLDDLVEFRIMNWNGLPFSNFATPITFKSVSLELQWDNDIAPPGIIGALDWYINDPDHLNPIASRDLAPSLLTYESTRFTKRYGVVGGTLRMQLAPETDWTLIGGGNFIPDSHEFELVFSVPAPSASFRSLSSGPPWEDLLVSGGPGIPEPSTYVMGGFGAFAVLVAGRRRHLRKTAE